MTQLVHQRYLDLVDEIEARFAVARWTSGDVDLWPPARVDLFLDLFKAGGADSAQAPPPFIPRAAGALGVFVEDHPQRRIKTGRQGVARHPLRGQRVADFVLDGF